MPCVPESRRSCRLSRKIRSWALVKMPYIPEPCRLIRIRFSRNRTKLCKSKCRHARRMTPEYMTALVFRQFGMNGTFQSGGSFRPPHPSLLRRPKNRRSENPVKRLPAPRIGQTLHSPGMIRQTTVLAVDRRFFCGIFSRRIFAASSPQFYPQPILTGYSHGFFPRHQFRSFTRRLSRYSRNNSKGYPLTHSQSLSPLPFTQSCITPMICSTGSEQPFFSHSRIIAISPLI